MIWNHTTTVKTAEIHHCIIKVAMEPLARYLERLINDCLNFGYFANAWKIGYHT